MEPVAKARLMAVVNEELAWGDIGLAITLGLSGFHQPWVQQTGDADLIERFCAPEQADHRLLGADGARPRQRHRRPHREPLQRSRA